MNSTQTGTYSFQSTLGDIGVTVEYAAEDGFITPVSVTIGGQAASLLDDAHSGKAAYFSDFQIALWQREAEKHHRRVTFAPDPTDPTDCFREPGRSAARRLASYFDRCTAAGF